jgi:hypothetical protein
MARDGDGAFWLQEVDRIWNSYWGERMLRCGSVKETFTATGTEGDPSNDAR